MGAVENLVSKENSCKKTLCCSEMDGKHLHWLIMYNIAGFVACSLKTKYKKLVKSMQSKEVAVSAVHLLNSF